MGSDQPVNSSIRLWFKKFNSFLEKVSFNYFGHFVSVVSSWHSWLYPITHLNTHLFHKYIFRFNSLCTGIMVRILLVRPRSIFQQFLVIHKKTNICIFSASYSPQRDCFIIFNLFRSRHFRICSSEADRNCYALCFQHCLLF